MEAWDGVEATCAKLLEVIGVPVARSGPGCRGLGRDRRTRFGMAAKFGRLEPRSLSPDPPVLLPEDPGAHYLGSHF